MVWRDSASEEVFTLMASICHTLMVQHRMMVPKVRQVEIIVILNCSTSKIIGQTCFKYHVEFFLFSFTIGWNKLDFQNLNSNSRQTKEWILCFYFFLLFTMASQDSWKRFICSFTQRQCWVPFQHKLDYLVFETVSAMDSTVSLASWALKPTCSHPSLIYAKISCYKLK